MTEGYLILGLTNDNIKRCELLAQSIKRLDPTRPVAAITYSNIEFRPIDIDEIVHTDTYTVTPMGLEYFNSVISSPFDRTIALLPNQLLTQFNPAVWENLRSLGPVVFPKHMLAYSYEQIDPTMYSNAQAELKSFGYASNINAGYFDKTLGSNDILGMAMVFASYNNTEYLNWLRKFKETNDTSLPIFPEYMWPQWIISLIRNILDDRIKIYDFVDCIELKMQDNNTHNNKWSKAPWNTFLKYWVTDAGEIKIENFIQNGLVHYTDVNWMSDADLTNLTNAFAK